MPRYVDAERMPNDKFWEDLTDKEKAKVLAYLLASPSVDVEEVRHGEWVRDADLVDGDVWVRWSCSECGYVRTRGWEYTNAGAKPQAKLCENCGAKMNEQEKNDDI